RHRAAQRTCSNHPAVGHRRLPGSTHRWARPCKSGRPPSCVILAHRMRRERPAKRIRNCLRRRLTRGFACSATPRRTSPRGCRCGSVLSCRGVVVHMELTRSLRRRLQPVLQAGAASGREDSMLDSDDGNDRLTRMVGRRTLPGLRAAGALGGALPAVAADPVDPAKFVREFGNEALARIRKDADSQARMEADFRELLAVYFDMNSISRLVLVRYLRSARPPPLAQ